MVSEKRWVALDGLRGAGALAIVAWHWQHFFALDGKPGRIDAQPFFALLKPLYVQGWAAVDLFFVLSGFVFFWLYGEALRTRRVGATAFAGARLSRLWPLHAAMLLLVAAGQFLYAYSGGFFFVYPANDGSHFVASLFMVQNWWPGAAQSFDGPSWLVSVEMLLYMLFFAACRAGVARGTQCLMLALWGALLLPVDEHIARGVVGFFMGGFAFTQWETLRARADLRRIAAWFTAATVAGWSVLIAALYLDRVRGGEGNALFLLLFDFGLAPLTVLTLALLEARGLRAPRWLGSLGDASYAVYLIHFPLQLALALLARRIGLHAAFFMQAGVFVAFVAVLLALSLACHHGFERPVMRWLRRPPVRAALAES